MPIGSCVRIFSHTTGNLASCTEVFILIRNYGDSLFASFEEFCNGVAEVNFFHAGGREATDLTDLLTDAWNFLATHENEEENRYYENGEFDDDLGLE